MEDLLFFFVFTYIWPQNAANFWSRTFVGFHEHLATKCSENSRSVRGTAHRKFGPGSGQKDQLDETKIETDSTNFDEIVFKNNVQNAEKYCSIAQLLAC